MSNEVDTQPEGRILERPADSYSYDDVYVLIAQRLGKAKPTDKDVARATKVSERRIRNARITGWVDAYIGDKIAIGIGVHPRNVWNDFDTTAAALFAADIKEGNISLEEAEAKVKVLP